MAFNNARLASARKAVQRHRKERDGDNFATTFDKPQMNNVLQTLETRLKGAQTSMVAAIESAEPGVFSTSDKTLLIAEVMQEFVLSELGRTR